MTMYVDSLKVSKHHKTLYFRHYKTPEIEKLNDNFRYVKVNSLVKFGGRIYTDSYGNAQADEDTLDNDEESVDVVSVFVGPKECEMVSYTASIKLLKLAKT